MHEAPNPALISYICLQFLSMNARDVRQTFLDFFRQKAHEILPSAPMVLKDDPTLMFTNAGMNPFKDWFVGNEPAKFPRVADTQKCLRVSGKHNDLEEVGRDTYHHTMFEMLGNWSFGDYFKEEAVSWAWELLTEVYKIPANQLYVTYFEGDAAENLSPDLETRDLWRKFLPEDRILTGNKKDNFWEMGDTGPCGPCTEIHVDIRPESERNSGTPGSEWVNRDHPQVIEVWNLVFMQFNRTADGTLKPLPNTHVDTGMGFERLCMVLQGTTSNYDTDVFKPYIQWLANTSGIPYGQAETTDIAMRVMADHIRAVALAITDGQLPSNTGAGYVIRRILRRAVRYGFSFLGFKEPTFYRLLPLLVSSLGEAFPELKQQQAFVSKVMEEEEMAFLRTLENGLGRLETLLQPGKTLDGQTAFELYDTYGFPFDLTALIAAEKGGMVDEAGFLSALAQQKERSRSAGKITADDWQQVQPDVPVQFVGYDQLQAVGRPIKFRKVEYKGQSRFQLVTDTTPFYPEGGGQVGDKGVWIGQDGECLQVLNTLRENQLIVHVVDRLPDNPNQEFEGQVDAVLRLDSARNHSATHLLHAALRQVLGTHVEQRGSLVNPDYLRFDFSHPGKISEEELQEIEGEVNRRIWANHSLQEHRDLPFQEALAAGAMALFGEKYGERVRMIVFDPAFSVELCGGTHVSATGAIGLFSLVSEGSVAAGIRRIEALTGRAAYEQARQTAQDWKQAGTMLKAPSKTLLALEESLSEMARLKTRLEMLEAQQGQQQWAELLKTAETHGEHKVLIAKTDLKADFLRNALFALRSAPESWFVVLGGQEAEKANLTVFASEHLVESGLDARQWIKELSVHIQGGGGGQPFLANAGGKNPAGLVAALEAARAKWARGGVM